MKPIAKLLILTLLLSMTACGDTAAPSDDSTAPGTGDTTPPPETEPVDPYDDELPEELNFEGRKFRIFIYKGGNVSTDPANWPRYIDVETQTGDVANDAAYKRNLQVEERLGVTIECTEHSNFSLILELERLILAQEDLYELALPYTTNKPIGLISQKLLWDVNETEYINLDKPYYNQSATETYRLGDANYIFSGEYPHPNVPSVFFLFNKQKWEDYKLENPYDLVWEGKWTHDKMMSLIKNTYSDVNGNTLEDEGDFFGLSTQRALYLYLYQSYGGQSVIPTDDGYTFGFNTEHASNIVDKLLALIQDENSYELDNGNYQTFKSGNSLLCLFGSSFYKLRDIEFDFGLLPTPKYDEEQENYITYQASNIAMIPITVTDTAFASAVIEALYSTSAKVMGEPFTQKFVENKLLRDEESQAIFRMLCQTSSFELTRFMDLSEGLIYNYAPISAILKSGLNTLASDWASLQKAVTKSYADFYESIN